MATLLKDTTWFKENAIDADFIVQNEQLDPLGSRHQPISSVEILNGFRAKADDLGLKLVNEQGALRKDGRRFNYVATIVNPDDPEFAMECGFTNYNDRSRSFRALYGTHCFICSNGCLHGVIEDSIARHTANNAKAIQGRVDLVFNHLATNMDVINKQLALLKATPLSTMLTSRLNYNLHEQKVLSSQNIVDFNIAIGGDMFYNEVENPTLNDKNDNTALRLLNAGTYVTTHKMTHPESKLTASKRFLDTLLKTVNECNGAIPVASRMYIA